jgi:hypothetical protein
LMIWSIQSFLKLKLLYFFKLKKAFIVIYAVIYILFFLSFFFGFDFFGSFPKIKTNGKFMTVEVES